MNSRPTSVTIIAWILMLTTLAGMISIVSTATNPKLMEMVEKEVAKGVLPLQAVFGLTITILALNGVCGIAMLKGHNWGRSLYVISTSINLILSLVINSLSPKVIPGFVMFVICTFFLFRPRANEFFFSSKETSGDQDS